MNPLERLEAELAGKRNGSVIHIVLGLTSVHVEYFWSCNAHACHHDEDAVLCESGIEQKCESLILVWHALSSCVCVCRDSCAAHTVSEDAAI